MVDAIKLLNDLVSRHVAPLLGEAGFTKVGARRFMSGAAPGNHVLVDFHSRQSDPAKVGFYLEWAIVPSAVCHYYNEDAARSSKPQLHWGIYSSRVPVPGHYASPYNLRAERAYWTFAVNGGLETCGAVLVELFVSEGLLDDLIRHQDREYTLEQYEKKSLRRSLPVSTPSGWPWRYLAMYLEDGDPVILAEYLKQVESTGIPESIIPWFRRRLEKRQAERY